MRSPAPVLLRCGQSSGLTSPSLAACSRKWWILHGLHSAGSITIDRGAFLALTRRESGGRLLPAGVIKVEGSFASLQAVRVIVRLPKDRSGERQQPPANERRRSSAFAQGEGSPSSGTTVPTTPSIQTQPTSPHLQTAPGTPTIVPAASLSSSVVSLDPPLSQPVPSAAASLSAALSAGVEALRVTGRSGDERPKLESLESRETIKPAGAAAVEEGGDAWEYVEVGKGQVHYNSSEIDRVKGLKACVLDVFPPLRLCPAPSLTRPSLRVPTCRSKMASVLGYADTEHVVDSITLKSSALQLLR